MLEALHKRTKNWLASQPDTSSLLRFEKLPSSGPMAEYPGHLDAATGAHPPDSEVGDPWTAF
jgi:hypothetical protein